jgi:ribosomal protein S27E
MTRPLSRNGRLCIAFAGVAIGVLFAVVVIVAPKLVPAFGAFSFMLSALGGFIGLGGSMGRQRAKGRAERDRIAGPPPMPPTKPHRADSIARPAAKTDTTTTNVRCHNCQHVQAVPRSQSTFKCEQCKAHLKRRTAPAKSS